jgi:energy-converting hydrogenase Eha subunit A
VVGLVLALAVVAIVVSLVGQWIVGIAIGAVALILFALFVAGYGRRGASPRRP